MTKIYTWADGTFYKTMEEAKEVVRRQHPINPEVWFEFIDEVEGECRECGETLENMWQIDNQRCDHCERVHEGELMDDWGRDDDWGRN